MKSTSIASVSFLIHAALFVFSPSRATAQASTRTLRSEVADTEFRCRTNPGEIILYFSQDGGRVLRKWDSFDQITLKWEKDRVLIGGDQDQDGPFYFQRRKGGGWEYAGHSCRVTTLPRR